MHDLKLIYICKEHGEVDGLFHEEYIEPDDCIGFYMCSHPGCTNEVHPKLGEGGCLCYRQMSPGELEWEYMSDKAFEDLYGY